MSLQPESRGAKKESEYLAPIPFPNDTWVAQRPSYVPFVCPNRTASSSSHTIDASFRWWPDVTFAWRSNLWKPQDERILSAINVGLKSQCWLHCRAKEAMLKATMGVMSLQHRKKKSKLPAFVLWCSFREVYMWGWSFTGGAVHTGVWDRTSLTDLAKSALPPGSQPKIYLKGTSHNVLFCQRTNTHHTGRTPVSMLLRFGLCLQLALFGIL